jgi:hypothetical protein
MPRLEAIGTTAAVGTDPSCKDDRGEGDLTMRVDKRGHIPVVLWIGAGLAAIALAACGPKPKTPVFLTSTFNQRGIDEITILPAVDLRQVEKRLDGSRHVSRTVAAALKRSHYGAVIADDFGIAAKPTEDDLSRPAPAWIQSLGPAKSRWVLLVSIVHLERHLTIGVKMQGDVRGYLFDKQSGELLWQGEGHGSFAMGYLLGGLVEGGTLEEATMDLMRSFPKRP